MPTPLRSALADLADADSVAHGVASTAAVAGLALIDPRRLRPGRRLLYRAVAAGLTAWSTWAVLRTEAAVLSPGARLGMVVGAAGATLGVAEAGEALDARMHDRLRAAGVDRPRALLAAAAGALSLAGWWFGRRSSAAAVATDASGYDDEASEQLIDVPDDVRALAGRLLAATDGFGAPELRAQLAGARAAVWEGPEPEGFWPGLGFAVPADAPLAVPGDASFPVLGRYHALDGRSFDVSLGVHDGRLAVLSIGEGRDWSDDERVAWMEADRGVHELPGWPSPDALELLIETSEGLRPVG